MAITFDVKIALMKTIEKRYSETKKLDMRVEDLATELSAGIGEPVSKSTVRSIMKAAGIETQIKQPTKKEAAAKREAFTHKQSQKIETLKEDMLTMEARLQDMYVSVRSLNTSIKGINTSLNILANANKNGSDSRAAVIQGKLFPTFNEHIEEF